MSPAASDTKVWSGFQSVVHMRMASSAAMPDRENGTAPRRGSPAAVAGKQRGNKTDPAGIGPAVLRRLIFAATAFLVVAVSGSASYAQSGPFTGMAGVWAGGGTITLDDG